MDYFDLLKGCSGAKDSGHEDTFGDLLRECRESAKEKIDEKQLKEYFDPADFVDSLDASYSKESFEKFGGYEVEELWDAIGSLVEEAREILVAVVAYAKEHGITRASELPGEFPTFWLETSDSFDIAAERDYSALEEVLQAVIEYGHPEEHIEESKVNEQDDTPVDTHGQEIKAGDEVEVVGAAPEAEKGGVWVINDISKEEGNWNVWVHRKDSPQVEDYFWSRKLELVESKKVNEQEPDDDLETDRPEKPRGKKPSTEEPDPGAHPEPPEEVKDADQPMEMRKEYLGKSEDTHYYFITTEGGEGIVEDFVITDQEGVKKYSAQAENIEVTEETIADFLIQAIRDVQIAQIERSIFMKYIYPKLIEEEPEEEEEELIEEPEGEEKSKKEKPLAPEESRESKKITDSIDAEPTDLQETMEILQEEWNTADVNSKVDLIVLLKEMMKVAQQVIESKTEKITDSVSEKKLKDLTDRELKSLLKNIERVTGMFPADVEADPSALDKLKAEVSRRAKTKKESKTDEDVSDWRKATSKEELRKMAAKKEPETKPEHEKENEAKGSKSKRLEITFTADKEKNAVNNLIDDHYKNLSVSKFEDETVVDGDSKSIAELRSDLQHLIIQFPGLHVEGSGTDEADEKCNKKVKENCLIEMNVTDDEGNEFEVHLIDDDTTDAVIDISGREFRFSPDFVSMWKDEEGKLSEEGLRELALDALANLEKEEYSELVAKGAEEEVSDDEDLVHGDGPVDKDKSVPEKEPEEKLGKEETTDDVDMSKGNIHKPLKYRTKKKKVVPVEIPPEEVDGSGGIGGEGDMSNPFESNESLITENGLKVGDKVVHLPDAPPSYQFNGVGRIVDIKASDGGLALHVKDRSGSIVQTHDDFVRLAKKNESKEIVEGSEEIERELDVLDQMSIGELRDKVGEEARRLPEKDDLIDAVMHNKFGDKYVKWVKQQVGFEKKNIKGDNEMNEKKLKDLTDGELKDLMSDLGKLGNKFPTDVGGLSSQQDKIADEISRRDREDKKDEGTNPKSDDSEETKKKKLAEEAELNETDVAKGAKALIQLAKDALKAGEYAKAAEYSTKLAEIEAVVPAEAEAEVDKKPEKKDDKKAGNKKADDEKADDEKADEQVDSEVVGEAKKKDKEAKTKKDKKDKEEKEKKAAAKKAKDKKESKIQVESTNDLSERKAEERLLDLLSMNS